MILTKEKLIYIHIPKTGGVSIESFILDYYGYERSVFNFTDGVGFNKVSSEKNGRDTMYPLMHFTLEWTEEELDKAHIPWDNSWTIFSVVRNPYYKFISGLFFSDHTSFSYHYHTLPRDAQTMLINECVDTLLSKTDYFKNYHSNHILPQYKFFENSKLPCQIFKFEEGLPNIITKLGFEIKEDFPHKLNIFKTKRIPRPNYKDILTPYLIEVVNEKYQKDFETFGYEMLDPRDFPN